MDLWSALTPAAVREARWPRAMGHLVHVIASLSVLFLYHGWMGVFRNHTAIAAGISVVGLFGALRLMEEIMFSVFEGNGVFATVVLAIALLPGVLHWMNFSIWRVSPLKEQLERLVGESVSYRCATFATVAHEETIFDPDCPDHTGIGAYGAYVKSVPTQVRKSVPKYFRIDQQTPSEAVTTILASTALPYGMFPNVKIANLRYFDAGLVDNCPVTPILAHGMFDEIFVVKLAPIESEQQVGEELRDRWQKLSRLADLVELGEEEAWKEYKDKVENKGRRMADPSFDVWFAEPPIVVPDRSPPYWPKFTVFAPTEVLGGFVRGTLNFKRSYARRLVQLGYGDVLRRYGLAGRERRTDS